MIEIIIQRAWQSMWDTQIYLTASLGLVVGTEQEGGLHTSPRWVSRRERIQVTNVDIATAKVKC